MSKTRISKMCFENEIDLFHRWFLDINRKSVVYKEPILEANVIKVFKQICDAFDQTTHVFILTVEVVEDYIRAKKACKQKISDALLAAVTITFMCHKFEGAPESLKVKHVVDLMYHLTQKSYSSAQVIAMEGDVIMALNGKIPLTTSLDDLDIILERYLCEMKLKNTLRPLCLKILEYLYMDRRKWFKEIKTIYSQNKDCMIVFKHLISSKFYIPVGVLVIAIQLLPFCHILDVDSVLADITKHTRIHEDHVRVLVAKLTELFNFV